MKRSELARALAAAKAAARSAGALMKRHQHRTKVVAASMQHDIKLELDVRCQRLIERSLRKEFPEVAVLGEEGVLGDAENSRRWVVDPIDGTVNFTYGIPHACVSIALQERAGNGRGEAGFTTTLGVVFDPFTQEMWWAVRGGHAYLNGRRVQVSGRSRLQEAIVTVGFAKHRRSLQGMLPVFELLVHRVRKIRILGSAALALTYVASGRMDAYLESGVRLWDIAAGGLILECAGGDFANEAIDDRHTYRLWANNGPLGRALASATRSGKGGKRR
jgi:myo-inositol-1(or 4)-monophosphatase